MLLLHSLPIIADAGPDLCTFALTFVPCACGVSINQCKYSTCKHGGGHWLQLALVVFFLQPLTQILLAPVHGGATHCNLRWWSFSFHPLAHIYTPLALEQLALCGGIYIYIYIQNAIMNNQQKLKILYICEHFSNYSTNCY